VRERHDLHPAAHDTPRRAGHHPELFRLMFRRDTVVGDLFRGSLFGSGAEAQPYMCDVEANRRDVAQTLREVAPQAQLFFVGHFGPVDRASVAEHFSVK
jgi:hypothetical protein